MTTKLKTLKEKINVNDLYSLSNYQMKTGIIQAIVREDSFPFSKEVEELDDVIGLFDDEICDSNSLYDLISDIEYELHNKLIPSTLVKTVKKLVELMKGVL